MLSKTRIALKPGMWAATWLVFLTAGVWSGLEIRPAGPVGLGDYGALLSDCSGEIRELVIQYVPEASAVVATVYSDFLSKLPAERSVLVVCPDRQAFEHLRKSLGVVRCRLQPVYSGHEMTCWSRDRWLALQPSNPGDPALLLLPWEENGGGTWPQRKGDHRIGLDLAAFLGPVLDARRSGLRFDGGDFVADDETVFVTPAVVQRNMGVAVSSADELAAMLSGTFKRDVVVLSDAPNHHAGMYMMPVGNRTILVGDPSLAEAEFKRDAGREAQDGAVAPDFSAATQARFDSVAERCEAIGYTVERIPVVPGMDGRTYVTYLNVIIDDRGDRKTVYLPVYREARALNQAAILKWSSLGYDVKTVDCTDAYPHFGSLRCLVNVLSREKGLLPESVS